MCQNPHNAVIHLGHQNGTVTLWTPNLPHPAVRLLAHLGPVASVSVDPSTGGRYMATAGQDGTVKVWDCRNWKGAVRTWNARGGSAVLEWSQKGALAVATGGSVNVSSMNGSPTSLINMACDLGIHQTVYTNPLRCICLPAPLSHTSRSSSTPHLRSLLSFPRYPRCRPLGRRIDHPCTRLWRAQPRHPRALHQPLRNNQAAARNRSPSLTAENPARDDQPGPELRGQPRLGV